MEGGSHLSHHGVMREKGGIEEGDKHQDNSSGVYDFSEYSRSVFRLS